MNREVLAFVILLILPALVTAQTNFCASVFNKHGITQLDCGQTGGINTVVISGLKDLGESHVFIGKDLEQAKKISRSFHKPDHPRCHDYFRVVGNPLTDAFLKPLNKQREPWRFIKAVAGLRK